MLSLGRGGLSIRLLRRSLPPAVLVLLTLVPGAGVREVAEASGSRNIEVTAGSVRVGELLPPGTGDGVGEEVLSRTVLSGLAPGEVRLLTPAEIVLRFRETGLDPVARGWSWSGAVTVRRRSQVVSVEELLAAGEEAVRAELDLEAGDEAQVSPVMHPRPLLAPVGEIGLDVTVERPKLRGGLWRATVTIRAGDACIVDTTLRYRVRVTADVLVTKRSIRRHEVPTDGDVTVEHREIDGVRGAPLRSVEALRGRRAARGASAGTVVTTEWLERVPAVHRGKLITAISRVGAVCARARVVSLSDGGVGEIVAVRAGRDKRQFAVRVTRPGMGEVVTSP